MLTDLMATIIRVRDFLLEITICCSDVLLLGVKKCLQFKAGRVINYSKEASSSGAAICAGDLLISSGHSCFQCVKLNF